MAEPATHRQGVLVLNQIAAAGLSRLPAEVDVLEVTLVVVMALFLSFVASIYPSWRAARTDPVEALRHG